MRRRSLIALAHATRTGFLVVTFASALVGGVVVHANTPAVRRLAVEFGNRAMASLFDGKITLRDVTSLSLGRRATVRVREAEATTPEGARVLFARDVEAEIDLAKLLRSLSAGRPDVELERVRIADAEVVLDADASGKLALERTFQHTLAEALPGTTTPAPTKTPAKEATPPSFVLKDARIARAHVHGNMVAPGLDGDATELAARVDLDKNVLTVTLASGRVVVRAPHAPNQTAPLAGSVQGFFSADLGSTPAIFRSKIDLRGSAGEIPLVAHAEMNGDEIEATVDVDRTEPAAIAKVLPTVPLTKAVELHAHAKGRLPTLTLDAHARVGEASATARGEIDLREGHGFSLDVDAANIDARAFGADVDTDLSGTVHGEGTLGGSAGSQGSFRVTTMPGFAASQPLPATKLEGRFDTQKVTAILHATEPGIDATGKVDVDLTRKSTGGVAMAPIVSFDLQARSDSLRALARAPNVASGTATARVRGKIDLENETVQATTNVTGQNVAASSFSARQVDANGVISGPIASPLLTVGFAGTDLELANGKKPLVYPTATGSAKIALSASPRVLSAEVNVTPPGGAEPITASIRGARIAHGVVETEGVRVTGLGEPLELDARIGNGSWNIRARSDGIDVHRAARMTGLKELHSLPEGTKATFDIDVRQADGPPSGHIDFSVRAEKALLGNRTLAAEVHADIDKGSLLGNARVVADGMGQIEITRAEIDLPDRLDKSSLSRATGTVDLRGSIDLSQGAALFAGENVERMSGIVSFDARIERGDPSSLPAVRATARTEGLEVALSAGPASPTLLIAGVDVQTHVAWDGRTDDAEVAVLGWDRHGLVGHAGAKAKLPLVAWATGAKNFEGRALADVAASAFAELPSRELSELPAFLGLPSLRGRVEGRISADGTVGHPSVVVSARARSIREDRRKNPGAQSFTPLDGTLEARWDGERASITLGLDERERRRRMNRRPPPGAVPLAGAPRPEPPPPPQPQKPQKPPGHLRALALVTDLRVRDILDGRPLSKLPWAASSEVEVENLELRALPAVPAGITGLMTGRARIKDLNRSATFEATAHVDDFGAGGVVVDGLDLSTTGRDAALFARAQIVDHQGTEPTQITAQFTSQSLRIQGIDVSWDPAASTRLDYAVQNGRLALLAPLVKSAVSEIDGRVDGTGSVTVDQTSQVFDGGLAVQDARLYVNVLGEEITSLGATARFDKSGTFRIDDANGKIGSGEFRASATGQMKGFRFIGGEATIIASKEGIPISAEGATFAEATGEAKVAAKMTDDRKTLQLAVDVPRANIQIPDRSTQVLQELDADPTIATGIRGAKGELDTSVVRKSRGGTGKQSATTAETLTTQVDIALGDAVRLDGRGLDVKLEGRAELEIAKEPSVTGQIDVRGGTIEVQGRAFTIDHGTVTFPDPTDPSNPTVVAAAYWDAPDRTRVWAEFAGPLKRNQVSLRSDPPYSQTEILSVLLFGRPDPNAATSSPTGGAATASGGSSSGQTDSSKNNQGTTTGTLAAGGAFFAAPLNQQLSRIDKELDVETDTTTAGARVKIGRSFFDRRLKVQVAPTIGSATYRDPDTVTIFLNWQFIPQWSVVAQRGDKGTSILDVLFQHRY